MTKRNAPKLEMTSEQSFFFTNGLYRLFGVFHGSENGNSPQPIFLVICHPFAEESIISRRVVVNMARKFILEGFPCLRFDYMGEGDSDGRFEDSTVESRLSDIAGAVTYARDNLHAEKIALVGIRLGATLAAMACTLIEGIDSLIMIAPITAGSSYLGQLLRSNLAFQMAAYRRIIKDREALMADLHCGQGVNVDGYLLTSNLYSEIEQLDLRNIKYASPPSMLFLDINRNDKQPAKKDIVSICEHYLSQGIHVDLETVSEQFFWADGRIYKPSAPSVEDAVTAWLNRNYG